MASYNSWQKMLPTTVEAMTVRLPGRDMRDDEPLPTSLRDVAVDIAGELESHLSGPFALFGHSMGALVAYELTLALRASCGVEPNCLIVSGMRPPDRVPDMARYSHLSEDELRCSVISWSGAQRAVLDDPNVWALFASIIRSDIAMFESYAYQPAEPLGCPIIAYGSHDDPEVDIEILEGWSNFTNGSSSARMFPGDHFYFQQWPEAFVMDLLNRLYQYLLL